MLIKCDETQNGVVCHLVGDLKHLAVGRFQEAVDRFSKKKHMIFEVSGVPSVDSVGLGALIHAVRRTHQMGGEAVVCGATPAVRKWVEIVAIPRAVSMFDNLTAAQAHFGGMTEVRAA